MIWDVKSIKRSNAKVKHIIKDVPYVSQENNIFCSYATRAMIFKYLNIDTSLNEVLFNSGVGYSLIYNKNNYTLLGGTLPSQRPFDQKFLARLYGLSYGIWQPNIQDLSEKECWNAYWSMVKKYVKNNIPVKTQINPFYLPAYKNVIWKQMQDYTYDTKKIRHLLFDMIFRYIPGSHAILIVGFDEKEKIVKYIDPYIGFKSIPNNNNKYLNVTIDDFKRGISKAKFGNVKPNFVIEVYEKDCEPLPKKEAFIIVNDRNIRKMNGDNSVYSKNFENIALGINALNKLKNDLSKTDNELNDIISKYKLYTLRTFFTKKFYHLFQKISNNEGHILFGTYQSIIAEKQYVTNYLKNCTISDKCEKIAELFNFEIEGWKKIENNFSKFIDRTILLTKSSTKEIIVNMRENLGDIIKIEEKILKETKN